MNYDQKIIPAKKENYPRLLEIWENSVRATHTFLKEADIQSIKRLIPAYLKEVELYLHKDSSEIISGFIGVAENRIEMLFIDPNIRGKGIGKKLTEFAIYNLHADELDVNEQNPQAVGFYKHIGFEVVGKSAIDGMGNPFPLLHMKLKKSKLS